MFLGIDLGTSAVKAVLVDGDQRVVDRAAAPLTVRRPRPLWSEQDPQAWWEALEAAVEALRARRGGELSALRAIGLSGQMHGATLLDARDRVLRPAILWNDGRSGAQCAELERRAPELRRITGNLAMPGFTAPKLLWVEEHEPDVFRRVARVLLPKDYLRLRLCGEYASDVSDASGTLWLDVGRRRWSEVMLEATHLPASAMPRPLRGRTRHRHAARRSRFRLGHAGGRRHRRRWRRQRRRRRRRRRGAPGARLPLARHVRGLLRRRRPFRAQSRRRRARLLPLPSGHVAPDVGHPQRGELPVVGSGGDRRRERSGPARRDRGRRRRSLACPLPPLPLRRAHAAQRPRRQGRVVRPAPRHDARRSRPRRARRRGVRLRRRPTGIAGRGDGDRSGGGDRRRRPQPAVGARSRQRPRRHAPLRRRGRGRAGVRRGASGASGGDRRGSRRRLRRAADRARRSSPIRRCASATGRDSTSIAACTASCATSSPPRREHRQEGPYESTVLRRNRPHRLRGPRQRQPARLSLVRRRARRARQADGGPSALRRLLLAHLLLAGRATCSAPARSSARGSRAATPMAAGRAQAARRRSSSSRSSARRSSPSTTATSRPEGATLRGEQRQPRPHRRAASRRQMARTGVRAAVGHGQPVQPPALRRRRRDQPGPGGVRLRGGAGAARRSRSTHRLGGANYVLWGGREGYDTLLNTDLRRESEQLGRFLRLVVEHKHRIGFRGTHPDRAEADGADQAPVRLRRRRGARVPAQVRPGERDQAQHRGQPRHAGRATASSTRSPTRSPTTCSAASTSTAAIRCSAGTPTSSRTVPTR